VIGRMLADGYITADQAQEAISGPVEMRPRDPNRSADAPYFAEEVRRELARRYGEEVLYQGGLSVRTTMDPKMQRIAERTLRDGLVAYDRRHGWRGPLGQLDMDHPAMVGTGWVTKLNEVPIPPGAGAWRMALVLRVDRAQAEIGLDDGATGTIPFEEMDWARPWLEDQRVGAKPERADKVLKPGDVVLVEPLVSDSTGDQEASRHRQRYSRFGKFPMLRAPSWRWIRIPGAFSPWPAGGISGKASSTARPRRCVSRDPLSNRSYT
jgi:penicillin-binding protein 1A